MTTTRILDGLCIAASMAVIGCRAQPTPVVLQGVAADIAVLAGQWGGQYSSAQTGRVGAITLTIRAGSDTAFGEVIMEAPPGQRYVAADVESRAHVQHATAPHLLRIAFVRIAGGAVEGALEPYIAPDCKCEVHTVFRGTVQGNTIRGDYLTTGAGTRQTGKWSVQRTKG